MERCVLIVFPATQYRSMSMTASMAAGGGKSVTGTLVVSNNRSRVTRKMMAEIQPVTSGNPNANLPVKR